jgi:drug/metabolite transporter (DMT)-like permease
MAEPAPASRPAPRAARLAGIGLMILALTCFAGLDASAKWLNQHIHPMQTIWLRFIGSVAIVTAFINPFTMPGVTVSARPGMQLLRSLFLFLSTLLNFIAISYLQLAETVAITFATPLTVALLAGPVLGEWVGPRRLAAIAVGFVGVLVITRPGLSGFKPAYLLSFGVVLVYAGYSITTRILAFSDSAQTTMFYSGLVGAVIMTPLVPFWPGPLPTLDLWLVIALAAFLGAFGHYLLILAHERAPAPILAPFIYTQIVTMTGLGYLLFGDVPDAYTLTGAGIVIASGLYLLYRERVTAKAPAKA